MVRLRNVVLASAAVVGALAGSASGTMYQWNWVVGDPGSPNNSGGTFESITGCYDTVTEELMWSVTFSNAITDGFTLALNNGPNPKGHAGELALLYVDARAADVKIAAYAYNGNNAIDSWKDGNGNVAGNQPSDFIQSFNLAGTMSDNAGKRTISFTIDASGINAHAPLYPDAVDPWYGIGFESKIGLWMHPFNTFNPTYNPNGSIASMSTSGQGWFDGSNFDTDIKLPSPGAATLAGAAGLMLARRRRR